MATEKKAPSRRELIEPNKGDKRYVRRKADGTFGKTVDVGKSLAADRQHSAKTKVPKGQGDRGDVKKPHRRLRTDGPALKEIPPRVQPWAQSNCSP